MKDIDSGNVGIKGGDVDDRDTGCVSFTDTDTRVARAIRCTDEDTRIARTRYVDQRKNVNHIEALDNIPIDEGSEDDFELVGRGKVTIMRVMLLQIITLPCFI